MTTVCTDGRTIACDSRITSDFIQTQGGKKLFKAPGILAGFSGCTMCFIPAFEWITGDRKTKPEFKKADFSAIVLRKDGVFYVDDEFYFDRVSAPYAIGSGSLYAMAALLAGATPQEAIKIAIKLDPHSGGRVQSAVFIARNGSRDAKNNNDSKTVRRDR